MSPHGGRRPGSGQPPIAGVPQTERIGLWMTTAERGEIEAAVPEGSSRSRWIVEAALLRARVEALIVGRPVTDRLLAELYELVTGGRHG